MKEAKPNERSETAEFLAMLALQVLPDNPELAARLGLTAIQMGRTGYITPLLFRLRRQNSSLADDLFNAALEIARSSYNEDLLDDLKIAAFPQVEIPSYRGETPPDALRNKFLLILAEAFLRTTVSSAEKIYVCRLAPKVVSLLNQYDSRLPEKAVIVRQAVLGCERSINKETQKSAGDSLSQEPLTIDDLVKASEEADSRSERTSYLIKAIRLARDLRKFETAIKLLDGISVDDREELKDIWSNWRWGCATDAAHEHFKKEDYASMRQILDAVPSDLRPLAQTTLANLIVGINPLSQNAIAVSIKTDKKPRPILIELMNGARSGLSSTSVKNKDKVGTYFYWGLIRLYAELAPFESVSVFYDGIKVLNKIDSSDIDIGVLPNGKDGNDLLEPLSLPPSLIEAAGSAVVLQYISSIESPSVRARFKLGLLRATLDKAQKIDRKGKQNDVPQKKSLQN